MARDLRHTGFFLLILFFCLACRKNGTEEQDRNQQPTVPGPVALAGADIAIYSPTNSTTLDGHASFHPDGASLQYLWTQVSGPVQVVFASPNTPYSYVSAFVEGIYEFQLQVKISNGSTDADTVKVTVHPLPQVPPVITITPVQLTPVATLPFNRESACVVAAGNKIFFAGGAQLINGRMIPFPDVNIYDLNNQSWSVTSLTEPRFEITGAVAANKIVFAGGVTVDGMATRRADIFDLPSGTWSTAGLSETRYDISIAGAGNKIAIAGGLTDRSWDFPIGSNRVDLYDAAANSWSTASLAEARGLIAGGSFNNKLIFAGGTATNGPSNRIDIYDVTTTAWSTALLGRPGTISATASAANIVHFVRSIGGNQSSFFTNSRDEQLNLLTGVVTGQLLQQFDFLSPLEAHVFAGAAVSGNYAVFVPQNLHHLLIYNTQNQRWSVSSQIQPMKVAAVLLINNQIHIVTDKEIWRLQI